MKDVISENESSNMANSIGVTFVMIILFSLEALSSKPIEEVDTVKVFEYFGSKIIQIRHIIQTPLKTVFTLIGIIIVAMAYHLLRGEGYMHRAQVIFMYNIQYSATWAAQQSLKALGYTVVSTIIYTTLAKELGELETSFVNINNVMQRQKRHVEDSAEVESFYQDVLIPACNQLFQTKGIFGDLLHGLIGILVRWIFWGICYLVLEPLPAPARYMLQ